MPKRDMKIAPPTLRGTGHNFGTGDLVPAEEVANVIRPRN